MSIGIGIYGSNGHQLQTPVVFGGLGRIVAAAECPNIIPPDGEAIARYSTLEELLADPRVELVSLCSPRRADQPQHAIAALRAGKHVYAEKPCALDEPALDAILRAASGSGCMFHEMAGSALEQPYLAMRDIIRAGRIGAVVQVIAEKSYPYHDGRPQDEEIDGGLLGQCAIHAFRFVEHVAGTRIRTVRAIQTSLGNPVANGGLQMAAATMLELENGGLATITANYLNARGTGVWGCDSLKILGTQGLIESQRGGQLTRLVIGEQDHGPLDISAPAPDFLETYLQAIAVQGEMPFSLEEELSSTRWAIRARQAAVQS